MVNLATKHGYRQAGVFVTLPGTYCAGMEKEEHRCKEHTGVGSKVHGNPSASTHSRWQPANDGDVAALPGTAAGRHTGRVKSRRRPSSAGAAGLWGGPHRCLYAIRGWV